MLRIYCLYARWTYSVSGNTFEKLFAMKLFRIIEWRKRQLNKEKNYCRDEGMTNKTRQYWTFKANDTWIIREIIQANIPLILNERKTTVSHTVINSFFFNYQLLQTYIPFYSGHKTQTFGERGQSISWKPVCSWYLIYRPCNSAKQNKAQRMTNIHYDWTEYWLDCIIKTMQ